MCDEREGEEKCFHFAYAETDMSRLVDEVGFEEPNGLIRISASTNNV